MAWSLTELLDRGLHGTDAGTATACARAYAALVGAAPAAQQMPWGATLLTRAALTARILAAQDPGPWPHALSRQLDPDDPAFLPPLGIHPVLAARDATYLGLPGRPGVAWVDPAGWCGVGDGPSVTVWFGDNRSGWTVGRVGATLGPSGPEGRPAPEQHREHDGLAVLTRCTRDGITLELLHWPIALEGRTAVALRARLTLEGPAPRPVRLAVAIRPSSSEGVAPIFHLRRLEDGLWLTDGFPMLALANAGNQIITGKHHATDPWRRFAGLGASADGSHPSETVDLHCPVGQATAAEVYRTTLSPGESMVQLAVIAPAITAPAALKRTSASTLLSGAIADGKGLLASGSVLVLERHQALFQAVRRRLVLDVGHEGLASMLADVALARLGFVRRAARRLSDRMGHVRRDGRFAGQEPEDGAILAWSVAQYVLWSGDLNWLVEHERPWSRLLDRLCEQPIGPGGRPWFGPEGSALWSEIWRAAGLLASALAHRTKSPSYERWALHGAELREALRVTMSTGPWTPSADRRPDGASSGMLAAPWLGLVPANEDAVKKTLDELRQHHWHGGGVLHQGGAHVAGTALYAAVRESLDPTFPALDTVAALASPTGSFPTARHPARGALGTGDDLLPAAMFAILVLERVQIQGGRVRLLSGLQSANDLPTPLGRVDVENGNVIGRWREPVTPRQP